MKARYLTFFSYIGTHFRSSEKIWMKTGSNYTDINSVQGTIEAALLKLRSINYPNVHLSSRTDGGVHALCATAHFDLDRYGTKIYEPYNISYQLNKFFTKTDTSISIKKCLLVPDNFDARRKALSRTYLYRFAFLRESVEIPENTSIASYIPIEEWRRCLFLRLKNFDVESLKEGAKYLVGYHDFTTFKKFNKPKETHNYKHNRRELLSVTVRAGSPLVTRHTRDHGNDIFDYWEVEFKGKAFVHNQIRRMLGALLGVAVGKLPPEEIKVMLQVPSKHSWNTALECCPAHGLYLCDVEYDPADLEYQPNQILKTDSDSDSETE
ncbi:unnamed protein product [Chilo suppressalis]|uniref:tRNA pseudouridine synthase n=1 Tax=Chilo suppressalis TaxID=168631 RepID=A0ABN8BFP7_CHISP|nr:hypothetical protein evm_000350 [Chilo suppressalis]CAH0406679.1 unnamed protein product [Chilo suppressalis]